MAFDFFIIGGLGDLAFRKLYPALYCLHRSGHLADDLRIMVVARQEMSAESFIELAYQRIRDFGDCDLDQAIWQAFARRLHYHHGDATHADFLSQLCSSKFADRERGIVIYFATPPQIILPLCKALQQSGLLRPSARLVIEKPLGNDLDSFTEIDRTFASICDQEQIYKIDHYLGKEAVQNLLALRFANTFLEPLWSNQYIDHVQINVLETVGVEGRWDFYDQTGAMRDMVQSHLLQLLCLVAMEPPGQLSGAPVHNAKLKVLLNLRNIDKDILQKCLVRGQYTAGTLDDQLICGYLQEENANITSDTETFVAIKTYIDNWRWSGVPFYLRTGKRMQRRSSEIVIQFRNVPHNIFSGIKPNRLVIRLQPDEGIRLYLMNKIPGIETTTKLDSVALDLSFSKVFASRDIPDAYERLLLDVLRGNDTLFMRSDELALAWQWTDSVIANWQDTAHQTVSYIAGSVSGPDECVALIAKDGREWY